MKEPFTPFYIDQPTQPDDLVAALFKKRFGHVLPDTPKHLVCYREGLATPLGYVHYQAYESIYLVGGMCVDSAVFKTLTVEDRRAIKQYGSVSEMLLWGGQHRVPDALAVFGHVGDPRAALVDQRFGFRFTAHPQLMVKWLKPLDEDQQHYWLEKIAALGAF